VVVGETLPDRGGGDPGVCLDHRVDAAVQAGNQAVALARFTTIALMTDLGALHGAALLQHGTEDLVAVTGGTAGSDPDTDCTLRTRFQIASVSKQFTAAAVLLLADRGVLSVRDPVRDWLNDCPADWEPVTVHQLLSHTSGLVHWDALPALDLTRPAASSDLLGSFASAPLLSSPGERFSYSSPGYVLLALIIEQATGQPYHAFLAREIFQPLGLTATFGGNPGGEPDLAAGREDGVAVPSFELDTVGLGTGSLWSTVGDLARWDRALASGEILSDAARQAMFSAHIPAGDANGFIHGGGLICTEGYGYGWFIGTVPGGGRIFYHPGDQAGFCSLNAWFPDNDARLAVLSNERATNLDLIARNLIQTVFPASTRAPR
jgi:CubicO group peptidase (beta-lactamase class C family)